MNFRDLVNEVLIRLREDTVATDWSGNINDSTSVSDYHKVIGSLVNDAKKHVEGAHDWLSLRETFTVSTVVGTMTYVLGNQSSGAGTSIKVLDVINQQTGIQLEQVSSTWLNSQAFPIANAANGEPFYYGFNGSTSVVSTRPKDINVDLYPVPTEIQSLNFNLIKRQDALKTATDSISVPSQPIILGAWARAISERGEDGGSQSSIIAQEAADSLKQSIMIDSGNAKFENDWYVR